MAACLEARAASAPKPRHRTRSKRLSTHPRAVPTPQTTRKRRQRPAAASHRSICGDRRPPHYLPPPEKRRADPAHAKPHSPRSNWCALVLSRELVRAAVEPPRALVLSRELVRSLLERPTARPLYLPLVGSPVKRQHQGR